MTSPSWTVVLPFKGGIQAKSRLGAPAELASAIAFDCLAAVLAAVGVGEVVVVTPDSALAAAARQAGARAVPESAPGSGLPAAIGDGLATTQGRCAVLLGDLPALRPEDLTTALAQAAVALAGEPSRLAPDWLEPGRRPIEQARPPMVFVPDAAGSGTVLLAALCRTAMRPAFGPDSARAHQAAGALRLDLDLPRLRQDVDTRDDLRTALALGVGPRTSAALEALSLH